MQQHSDNSDLVQQLEKQSAASAGGLNQLKAQLEKVQH